MATPKPHLTIDIDGVFRVPKMQYGNEQHRTVEEHIPVDMVHPDVRPRQMRDAHRQAQPLRFRTHVRVSRKLFQYQKSLGPHVVRLIT